MNWLKQFPDSKKLIDLYPAIEVLNVNAHVHTPYSFSAFESIAQLFRFATREQIAVLGINDFFVTGGYESFMHEAMNQRIFPLFNLEFIGLMKEEQQANIRVNDPHNPGRCYFCGKGLDYPFHTSSKNLEKLNKIVALSQNQVQLMLEKLNMIFSEIRSPIRLDYKIIKKRYAKDLVRERHLAMAIRIEVFNNYDDDATRISVFTRLFNDRPPKSGLKDIPGLENEIRSNLLKAGGRAFVEEDVETFLGIDEIMDIVVDSGGIPCYPVLLDDKNGNYTEFEASPGNLLHQLRSLKVNCIELIPGRNEAENLEKLVRFFDSNGFVILMGTEHNTPEMIPMTCDTRGNMPLSAHMKSISYKGACIVAAHQYMRAKGLEGFTFDTDENQIEYLSRLGNAIIHYQRKNL